MNADGIPLFYNESSWSFIRDIKGDITKVIPLDIIACNYLVQGLIFYTLRA
jgi:hypothetical protein